MCPNIAVIGSGYLGTTHAVVVWLGPRGLHPDPARFGRWLTIAGAWVLVTSGLMVLLDYHWIMTSRVAGRSARSPRRSPSPS